jgi:hypothetical protein
MVANPSKRRRSVVLSLLGGRVLGIEMLLHLNLLIDFSETEGIYPMIYFIKHDSNFKV